MLAGQIAGHWRQLQYRPQHSRHEAVAVQDLVVENKILQVASFGGHQHHPMRGIQRSYGTVGTGSQFQTVGGAATDAHSTSKTNVGVKRGRAPAPAAFALDRAVIAGSRRRFVFLQSLDGAGRQAFTATDACFRIQFNNEIGMNGLSDAETLYGQKSFATATTAVANKIDAYSLLFPE